MTPGDYVTVTVSDMGGGMPEHVRARIFEPFFTTKALGQGSGLGLSMVHGFVRQSGGHTSVERTMDEGTSIALHLPRGAGYHVLEAAPCRGGSAAATWRRRGGRGVLD